MGQLVGDLWSESPHGLLKPRTRHPEAIRTEFGSLVARLANCRQDAAIDVDDLTIHEIAR